MKENPLDPPLALSPPENKLPSWDACHEAIEVGQETPLHRFIYEYDDADSVCSAWFLHRLETLIDAVRAEADNYYGHLLRAANARGDGNGRS